MNKFLRFSLMALMAIVFGSNVYADDYTVTFKETGTTSDSGERQTTIEGLVETGGSIFSEVTADNAFQGRTGRGVKLGTSSKTGSMEFTLASKMNIQTIKFKARKYNDSETSIIVNGKTFEALTGDFDEYTVELNGAEVEKISISTPAKRAYITTLVISTPSSSGGGGGNATESYYAISEDGTLADEFTNAQLVGTDLVFSYAGTHATVKGLSSKTPKDLLADNGYTETQTFDNTNWPEWNDATWSQANKNKNIWHYDTDGTTQIHDFQFRSVWGKGNPVTGWKSKVVTTDDTFSKLIADYEGYYFVPGVSTSVPVAGEYFEFKADVDGMFKIGFYTPNGANRYMYIVEKSTVRTLGLSEFKVEGYVNGCDNIDGSPMYQSSIKVNDDYSIGDAEFNQSYKDQALTVVNQLNQPKYGWFVFDAKANETYMIFGPNYQFGFRSYEFTPGAKISEYTPTNPATGIEAITTKANNAWNANAQMYNLSGQKVDKSYKGIVIQNGRKFVNK